MVDTQQLIDTLSREAARAHMTPRRSMRRACWRC